jgi:hypothetical protein
MPDESAIVGQLRRLEEELLSPSVSADRAAQLLADEFIEFGSSGNVHGKAQVVAAFCSGTRPVITAANYSAIHLSPESVLLTYHACRHSSPAVLSLRSSLWQRQNGQWRMIFHQGTISESFGNEV